MTLRSLLLLLLVSSPAGAQIPLGIALKADLAAGYDSNIYLQTAALPAELEAVGGGVFQVEPSIRAVLGPGQSHNLALDYGADFRQYALTSGGHESLLHHHCDLTYTSPPLWGFKFSMTAGLDHLVLAEQPGGGWIAFGGRAAMRRALGDALRAALEYRVEYAAFGLLSSVERQVSHGPVASLGWRVAPGLVLEPSYALTLDTGEPEEMEAIQHQAGLSASWRLPWVPLRLRVGYQVTFLDLTASVTTFNPAGKPVAGPPVERADVLHQVGEEARLEGTGWLEIFVRHESTWGQSNVEQDYGGHQVLAGVVLHHGWERPSAAARSAHKAQRRLEVRYKDDSARSVSVVGSFNGWDPRHSPLRRHDGAWEISVVLPPGRHSYMLWADGKIRPPPGCVTWTDDGFGGQNCVVIFH